MNAVRSAPAVAQRPPRWAEWTVLLSTRLLPRGSGRDRYRRELVADLWGLQGREVRRYVASVLANAPALRSAVAASAASHPEVTMKTTKPLACRLNVHHHWKMMTTEDGKRYKACERCYKEFWTHSVVFHGG